MKGIKSSEVRLIGLALLMLMFGCVLAVAAHAIRKAQREARRSSAYGRLCQMRFALQIYEQEHGALPPLWLRDDSGRLLRAITIIDIPLVTIIEEV
jgi:hypothetical protein